MTQKQTFPHGNGHDFTAGAARPDTSAETHIHLGDCIDVMKEVRDNSVNMVLTDPPYLVNYHDRTGRKVANDDNADWLAPAFQEVGRILEDDSFCVSFYGWSKVDLFMSAWQAAGLTPVGHFTFPKSYVSSVNFTGYAHENAYLLVKGRPRRPASPPRDVIAWQYSGNKLHPTQKPLSVLLPLVDAYSEPGRLVYDPFCGSGSSLVAAKLLGRAYGGCELDPGNYEIACARLQACGTVVEPAALAA